MPRHRPGAARTRAWQAHGAPFLHFPHPLPPNVSAEPADPLASRGLPPTGVQGLLASLRALWSAGFARRARPGTAAAGDSGSDRLAQRLALVAEHSPAAAWITDTQDRIEWANAAFLRLASAPDAGPARASGWRWRWPTSAWCWCSAMN